MPELRCWVSALFFRGNLIKNLLTAPKVKLGQRWRRRSALTLVDSQIQADKEAMEKQPDTMAVAANGQKRAGGKDEIPPSGRRNPSVKTSVIQEPRRSLELLL